MSAAGSGEGPAGGKAAAEKAFTFRWGEPGRSEEREPSAQWGLNPDNPSSLAVALASRVLGRVKRSRREGNGGTDFPRFSLDPGAGGWPAAGASADVTRAPEVPAGRTTTSGLSH